MSKEFIKDCLSRELSLNEISLKYQIGVSDILDEYKASKLNYTDDEINKLMYEVYYTKQ